MTQPDTTQSPFDGGTIPVRLKWRIAQIAARNFDHMYPRWWTDRRLCSDLLARLTPPYRRMWEELIRQRTGE